MRARVAPLLALIAAVGVSGCQALRPTPEPGTVLATDVDTLTLIVADLELTLRRDAYRYAPARTADGRDSIAVALWKFPATVLGETQTAEEPDTAVDSDALLYIGISLLGLYVLVFGMLEFMSAVSFHMMIVEYQSPSGLPAEIKSRYIVSTVQILLGVVLLLGKTGMTRLISKARRAGSGSP